MHMEVSEATPFLGDDDQLWFDLSSWLFPFIHLWVCCSGVPSWRGQYKEIAEEVTQETLLRTFRYMQRAELGEVPAVVSLKSLSRVIAQNHFRDRYKKDSRLIHMTHEAIFFEPGLSTDAQSDPSEIAFDRLLSSAVIVTAAETLVQFPKQQRKALLTDLANTDELDGQPTLLEQTLSAHGITLRDYQQALPTDRRERNNHATLLCIAYKRLRNTVHV